MNRNVTKLFLSFLIITALSGSLAACGLSSNDSGKKDTDKTSEAGVKAGRRKSDTSKEEVDLESLSIISVSHSPGYSDMSGSYHMDMLMKDPQEGWIIISYNRDMIGQPTSVTTYEVSPKRLLQFDKFIMENDIVSMADRAQGSNFMTDYSPWTYTIRIKGSADEGSKYYTFDDYLEYSEEDYKLIEKLNKRFEDLRGDVIKEETVDE